MAKFLVILWFIFYAVSPFALNNTLAINQHMKNYPEFSGALSINKNGKMFFEKAYGFASFEFKITNSLQTKFPIASNTKPITAAAIMMLHEQNKLNVNEKVNRYLQGINDAVTIHHLLTHTSGIPNYYGDYWEKFIAQRSHLERLEEVKKWPLAFAPGLRFAYSNTGYYLLALLIEKVSGQSYEEFLKAHIFSKAFMTQSGSLAQGEVVLNKAYGYQVKENRLYNAANLIHPEVLLGNGDLYSTASDMSFFIDTLFAGKIINKNNLSLLIAPHIKTTLNNERSHAYGWFIDTIEGQRIAEYSGAVVGYLSKIIHFIDSNSTVVILSNRENAQEFQKICDGIAKIVK